MGFAFDAAQSAALTIPDPQATERIFDACDWENLEHFRESIINNAVRKLNKNNRSFVRAVLRGLRWSDLGISRQAFFCKLKKICILLETTENKGRKPLLKARYEAIFS